MIRGAASAWAYESILRVLDQAPIPRIDLPGTVIL